MISNGSVFRVATSAAGNFLQRLRRLAHFRWLLVGGSFLFVNAALMALLVEGLGLAVFPATVVSAELCTILRFFINEHWVFRTGRSCWIRLWQFHLANASAFFVWLAVTNLLIHGGLHYQLAAVAGVGCSVGASFLSNFFWVWGRHHRWRDLLLWRNSAP
jgi:putative flippase GtrA